MSPRLHLIQFLVGMNVRRAECRAMLEQFDELYPEQAAQCEPEEKLYELLTDRVVLAETPSAFERNRRKDLYGLIDFFLKRQKGEVGDILLMDDVRLHGLIEDWVKKYYIRKQK